MTDLNVQVLGPYETQNFETYTYNNDYEFEIQRRHAPGKNPVREENRQENNSERNQHVEKVII